MFGRDTINVSWWMLVMLALDTETGGQAEALTVALLQGEPTFQPNREESPPLPSHQHCFLWRCFRSEEQRLIGAKEKRRRSHLSVGQHDILDEGQPPGLAVLHAHIVDLVAADLTVLLARRQGAPHHLDGRGVQDLHLHPPGRGPGN